MGKNIIKVLTSNVVIAFIGITTSFVFPKIMDFNSYAEYQTFNLYLSYIAVCQMGISTGMVINYAGKDYKSMDKKQYKSEIFLLLFIQMIFEFIGIVITVFTKSNVLKLLCYILIPYQITESYKSLYQAWNKFTIYSIINTIIPLFRVCLAFILFFVKKELSGQSLIDITIIAYAAISIYFMVEFCRVTRNIKAITLFNRRNRETMILGIKIMIGNYLDIIFKTIDKLYIKLFFSTYQFALYSFTLTVQNIMKIFISSIAQPMLPELAIGKVDEQNMNKYKEMLIIFGSLSGCAYFVCAMVIMYFLPDYIYSLDIMHVYFLVFPSLAVINCLFLNLYKIRKETKSYVTSLVIILALAIVLDATVVLLKYDSIYIAVATVIVYYIWLIYGCRHFDFLKLKNNDIMYLFTFALIYGITKHLNHLVLGLLLYTAGISVCALLFYNETSMQILLYSKKFLRISRKNG